MSSVYGTLYGDDGWFASGGSGTFQNAFGEVFPGGGSSGSTIANPAQKNTGGGGGGTYGGASLPGNHGGSGIVLISDVPGASSFTPSLTYDGYNKLTVAGASAQTLYKDSNSWSLGTASSVYIADPGEYTYFTRDTATAFLANVTVAAVTNDLTWVGAGSTEVKVVASDAVYNDVFGWSVAIDGDYVVVGAPRHVVAGAGAGAVYVYKKDGGNWNQVANLSSGVTNQGTYGDLFGISVSIHGDTIIVGSRGVSNFSGAAYIFTRNEGTDNWSNRYEITGSGDFGMSVAIYNDTVLIGAYTDTNNSSESTGTAFIYERNGNVWDFVVKFIGETIYNAFGYNCAIYGNTAIVISNQNDTSKGAAYIYTRTGTTWSTTPYKIPGEANYDYLSAVSVSGNTIVLGTHYNDSVGTSSGAVYIYTGSGTSWVKQTEINGAAGESWGRDVSISGDILSFTSTLGKSYIYKRSGTTWTQQVEIIGDGDFGKSVAIDGDYAIVGAESEDTGGSTDAGAAYIYNILENTPPTTLTYDGITNLKVTGAETGSTITYKNATSDKLLACGTDLVTYPLYTAGGNYKVEVSGATTFTLTSNVTVPTGELLPLYHYPPTGGTTSSLTESTTSDTNSTWTISGASYGTGIYKAQSNVAATSSATAYHAFDSNVTAGFENTSATTGTLTLQLPSAETIHKYVVWPKAADGKRPNSWTVEGSQDGNSWTTIHTVTGSPPSLTGDAHTITTPGAYVRYRINVTANAGGTGLEIAELALYGDVAFSITFSDGWVTTTGSTSVALGSTYTLPTYTSSLPVVQTGSLDVNTVGTYRVVYTSIGIDELARRVVRRFVVEYPVTAFHYAGFVATDYSSAYSTKELAAAAGFVYADTPGGTYSWGTLAVVSNTTSNTQYTWTPSSAMTANVLGVGGGGGGGAHMGGGGGAGGLLFYDGETLSGQKTIVVGNGGSGSTYVDNASLVGDNGSNTHFTNLTSVIGGGGGASYYVHTAGNDGGSGGGGGAGGSNTGGAGTSSQGFAGGTGLNVNWAGGGGGGAMAVGSNASANTGGTGGAGKDLSTQFDIVYGDNGYFAGGGGGGGQSTGGGGGVGGGADGSRNAVIPTNAIKHTGGGGGGARGGGGSNAGSGVVIIKQTS